MSPGNFDPERTPPAQDKIQQIAPEDSIVAPHSLRPEFFSSLLGVDCGVFGWNARAAVSYLITHWVDVTLGYKAIRTRRNEGAGPRGENRSLDLLSYGPVLAFGLRF